MAYRVASGAFARRVGEMSSGPRTVGYDANPRGLAGTSSTASDYKRNKKKKDEDMVRLGDAPPYDDSPTEDTQGITYFTEYGNEPYTEERVVIGQGESGTNGEGWILSLRMGEYAKDAVITGTASSFYFIQDVSDKGQIKLPTAPLENGMVKHDHKVIMPKTMRVTGWVKRENTDFINSLIKYAEMSKSLGTYFTLVSPWKKYPKMYLKDYSSKASNKKYDVYDYTLDLSELLIAKDLKDTTDDPELASNTDKGSASGR